MSPVLQLQPTSSHCSQSRIGYAPRMPLQQYPTLLPKQKNPNNGLCIKTISNQLRTIHTL